MALPQASPTPPGSELSIEDGRVKGLGSRVSGISLFIFRVLFMQNPREY